MVVEVYNTLNNPMHYGDTIPVKYLDAPDKLPKRQWYSDTEASRIYTQMETDIYDGVQNAKPIQKKFPKVLKIIGIIAAATALIIGGKSAIPTLKKLFKKTPKP